MEFHAGEQDSLIGKFLTENYAPLLTKRPCQFVSAVILLIMIGLTVYTSIWLNLDNIHRQDVHSGLGLQAEARNQQKMDFPKQPTRVAIMFDARIKYFDATVQRNVMKICNQSKELPFVIKGMTPRCWMNALFEHQNGSLSNDAATFRAQLKSFVSKPSFRRYRRDVIWDGDSIFRTQLSIPVFAPDNIAEALQMNKTMYDSLDRSIGWRGSMLHLEEARNVTLFINDFFGIIALVFASVFLITGLLLVNPLSSIIVVLAMLLSTGSAYGMLQLMGYQIGYLHLIMGAVSFGTSVDFTSHMCHQFNVSCANNILNRLRITFRDIGPSVFYAFLTNVSLLLMLGVLQGPLFVVSSVISFSSLFGWIFAFSSVPLLLQIGTFPPAIREFEMENKLRSKTDDVLLKQFERDEEEE
eukprot:TRINITY_DN10796_c0_g1_i2.p1 TRINITY_DN10796_c0_g1~~TRINITY_DN10796_c0_g1_i2.p1  ORF type:complete len:412 (-),score=101.44 TRINITY_DN10796_c0_g1_i2:16-1251(-)